VHGIPLDHSSCFGLFSRICAKIAAKGRKPDRLMIDAFP